MKPSGPPSSTIKSPQYSPRGPVLSDKKIESYIRKGFYGEEKRLALEARDKAKRPSLSRKRSTPGNPKKPVSPTSSLTGLLRALGIND